MRQAYHAAHDLIATGRWTKGAYNRAEDIGLCYCLVGALREVSGAESHSPEMGRLLAPLLAALPETFITDTLFRLNADKFYPACAVAAARAGDFSHDHNLNHDIAVAWNDADGRSRAEVVALLARVIQEDPGMSLVRNRLALALGPVAFSSLMGFLFGEAAFAASALVAVVLVLSVAALAARSDDGYNPWEPGE